MHDSDSAIPNHFFNLGDLHLGLEKELAPGLTTRIFPGDQLMLSVVTVSPNCRSEVHSHPEEQWGLLLEGNGVRTQDGIDVNVNAGDFWRTPGGVPHGFSAGADGAKILDIFSPPRAEYRK